MEPFDGRPDLKIREERFATRMKPWIAYPKARYMKVTLVNDPRRVIGHAGWLVPGPEHVLHHWRVDAAEKNGWREQQGWSQEFEDELWSHANKAGWQKVFEEYDDIRKEEMKGEPHWYVELLTNFRSC